MFFKAFLEIAGIYFNGAPVFYQGFCVCFCVIIRFRPQKGKTWPLPGYAPSSAGGGIGIRKSNREKRDETPADFPGVLLNI